jgi:hypothetical protein
MLTADKITKVAKTTGPRPARPLASEKESSSDEKGGAELGKIGLSAHEFGTTE